MGGRGVGRFSFGGGLLVNIVDLLLRRYRWSLQIRRRYCRTALGHSRLRLVVPSLRLTLSLLRLSSDTRWYYENPLCRSTSNIYLDMPSFFSHSFVQSVLEFDNRHTESSPFASVPWFHNDNTFDFLLARLCS